MSDYSADSFDQASEVEAMFREKAIAAARASVIIPSDFDGKHCIDCDLEISAGRLALGKFTCIYCQELRERNVR